MSDSGNCSDDVARFYQNAAASADGEDQDFYDTLFRELELDSEDTPTCDMLIDMVHGGDFDVIADILASLVDDGCPQWAAGLCSRLIYAESFDKDPEYQTCAMCMGTMVEKHCIQQALEVCKALVAERSNEFGLAYLDVFDVSFVLGSMVNIGHPEWAAEICYAMYCDDAPVQEMLPYTLGMLCDCGYVGWAAEICKQLIKPDTLPKDGPDYACLGWTLAQMVFIGRSDWASAICDVLVMEPSEWFTLRALLDAVTACGDAAYSQTICNFMTALPVRSDTPLSAEDADTDIVAQLCSRNVGGNGRTQQKGWWVEEPCGAGDDDIVWLETPGLHVYSTAQTGCAYSQPWDIPQKASHAWDVSGPAGV